MAIFRQRLHHLGGAGYDVIHFETSSDIVLRPTGENVEKALTDLESIAPRCASSIPESMKPGSVVIIGKDVYVGAEDGSPICLTGLISTASEQDVSIGNIEPSSES